MIRYKGIKYKGFTMIEFIIASSLTLLVLALGSQSLSSSQNIVKKSGDREIMNSIAMSTLEKAKAFGCGSEYDVESTAQSADCATLVPLFSSNQSITDKIKALSGVSEVRGDALYSTNLTQGYTLAGTGRTTTMSVLMASAYVKSDSTFSDLCGSAPSSGSNLIRRDVTINWKDYLKNTNVLKVTSYSATSKVVNFNSGSHSFVVPVYTDNVALLLIKGNVGLLKILPKSCSASSSYIFRGLKPGSYTIKSYNIDSNGVPTILASSDSWTQV